jgi:hypothetical protein
MWRRVVLVKSNASEEFNASIFSVEKSVFIPLTFVFADRFLHHEVAGDTILRKIGSYKTHTAPHAIKQHSSQLTYL